MKQWNALKAGLALSAGGLHLWPVAVGLRLLFSDPAGSDRWAALLWTGAALVTIIAASWGLLVSSGEKKTRARPAAAVVAACSLVLILLVPLHQVYAVLASVAAVAVVSVLCGRIWTIFLTVALGAAVAAWLPALDRGATVAPVGAVLVVTLALAETAREIIGQTNRQAHLFDQARWAASELANTIMRLQDSIYRTEIKTRDQERQRVAREVHDTVGYSLTAILVQISVARELAGGSEPRLVNRLEALEGMVRTAIADVRAEVSRLRQREDQKESWRAKWVRLCDTFADCTGLRVHTEIPASIEPVPEDVGATVYRIIQESLTNAYRHGRATLVDVGIGRERTDLLLRISDNGAGTENLQLGNGLSGIRERVYALGGNVVMLTRPGKGFNVGVEIPLVREKTLVTH